MSSLPNPNGNRPVIIGTGITGLATSRSLSRAGIDHLLVGRQPSDNPRLGESLDTTASMELAQEYPEFSEHYYTKSEFRLFLGRQAATCNLRLGSRAAIAAPLILGGVKPPPYLLHVDRIGLDRDFFKSAVASQHCHWLEDLVVSCDYDSSTDKITRIELDSGARESASFVIDATYESGPVTRAANLKFDYLSSAQTVAFAHLHAQADTRDSSSRASWLEATTLVRLTTKHDGIDGFAWCIPVGDVLSVGVTVESDAFDGTSGELIELTRKAYLERGVDWYAEFPRMGEGKLIRHRYFMHQRVVGTNWILAGPSACQVWFMSGAGVGVGLAAARLIPKMLRSQRKYGSFYQRYIQDLRNSHRILDRLRYCDSEAVERDSINRDLDGLIHANVKRTGRYLSIRGARLSTALTYFGHRLAVNRLALRDYCAIEDCEAGGAGNGH